jgi:hypothetical protein
MRIIVLFVLILVSCQSEILEVENEYMIEFGGNHKKTFKFQLGNLNDTIFLKEIIIDSFSHDSFYFMKSEKFDSIIISSYLYHGSNIYIYKHNTFGPIFCTNRGVADFECRLISSNYIDSNKVNILVNFCKKTDSIHFQVPPIFEEEGLITK